MNDSSSAQDADDIVLAQFQREYLAATDRDAVVADYCSQYPHLERRIRGRAEMLGLLADSRPEPPEPLPEWLGEFRVVRRIDHGGMGEIYLAKHERLSRLVAVKVIRPGRASAESLDRFRREQRALARLHQTHIVSIYAAGEQGGVHYFAMPHIEGAALNHVVAEAVALETGQPHGRTPPLSQLAQKLAAESDLTGAVSTIGPDMVPSPTPPPAVMTSRPLKLSPEYFRSVAEALADAAEALHHAHEAGIVHRDVKPGNLMVDKQGHCWVIDFGLAGSLADGPGDDVLSATPVSATGMHGTPPYMAPEQWSGGKTDARTDVWGLGVTLYELLTLRRAFPGATMDETREMIVGEINPMSPRSLVLGLPEDLEAICLKAMRKQSGQRYPTALGLAQDLRRWLTGHTTVARPAWPLRRAWMWSIRNPGWALSLGLAAVVLMLTGLSGYGTAYLAEREVEGTKERERVAKEIGEAQQRLAKEKEEAQRRRVHLLQLERLRLMSPHASGWSDDAWAKVRELAESGTDSELRDSAAATLSGIDARVSKEFPGFTSTSLAFDRKGRRLLMGGSKDEPTRIWDGTSAAPVLSNQPRSGPVAFKGDSPIQVMVQDDARALLLWDVSEQKKVRELLISFKQKLQPGTTPSLHSIELSDDGRTVAAAFHVPAEKGVNADQGIVLVWDADTGKLTHEFPSFCTALAVSPDNAYLAAGDRDGRIVLWDLTKGGQVGNLKWKRGSIRCLDFGHNAWQQAGGKAGLGEWLLAAGGQGGLLAVWDLDTMAPKVQCLGSQHDVFAVAFSPDRVTLASAGRREAKLWDVATGRLLLDVGHENTMKALAFSPDGRQLAVSSHANFGSPGRVRVWDVTPGRGIRTLRGLAQEVVQVVMSADAKLIAAVAQDWEAAVWDRESGRLLRVFQTPVGGTADNAGLAISGDNKQFAFCSGREARLWDITSGEELKSWKLPPGYSDQFAFHPSGRLLLFRAEPEDGGDGPAGQTRYICRLRDLKSARPAEPLMESSAFQQRVFASTRTVDGSHFAVEGVGGPGGKVQTVKVFEGSTGKELWSQEVEFGSNGRALTIDPTAKVLARSSETGREGVIIELATGKSIHRWKRMPAALGPAGRVWNFLGPYGFGLALYQGKEDDPLVTLNISKRISSVSVPFDATGTYLAWGNADGSVSVADLPEIQRRLASVGLGW